MNIIKYQALIETIECQSLTKAAKALGYTQPGISHMIHSLEEEFGFPLLLRSRDGIRPTEDARKLLGWLKEIVNSEEKLKETVRRINGIETGTVKFACFYSAFVRFLPPIIKQFSEKHPGIELKLYIGDQKEIVDWFGEGKIDLAVMSKPEEPGIQFAPLMEDPICAILPSEHLLVKETVIEPEQLAGNSFILPDDSVDKAILQVFRENHLAAEKIYRVKGDEAILAMVESGLGITILPLLMAEKSKRDIVVRHLPDRYRRVLGLASPAGQERSPAAEAFAKLTGHAIPDRTGRKYI